MEQCTFLVESTLKKIYIRQRKILHHSKLFILQQGAYSGKLFVLVGKKKTCVLCIPSKNKSKQSKRWHALNFHSSTTVAAAAAAVSNNNKNEKKNTK